MRRLQAIHALARFARAVSANAANADALQLLADTLVDLAGCDGAAVFQVKADRMWLVASRNLPDRLRSWNADAEEIGGPLERALMSECGVDFVQVKTVPLVSGGALFGAVLIFWKKPDDGSDSTPWHDEVAHGLADLAATVLATSAHAQRLAQANEEIRRSHEVLLRTEQVRALGQMAAGVSHDLRNIVSPLSLQLQVARRANARGNKEEVDDALRGMKGALARGIEVLERLRNFSRHTPSARLAAVDLNSLTHEAVMLAAPRMASRNRLCCVREAYGAPPRVLGEPAEIVSAVLNLLANAADAMTECGETITVSTGARDGGGWIIVKDDGPGMSAEVRAHAFEPFFTTKGDDGTGLGLASVYAAVCSRGGTVGLDSEPGHGATFTLWFPPAGGRSEDASRP